MAGRIHGGRRVAQASGHLQYWHRSLNPKKLISINFSRLAVRL